MATDADADRVVIVKYFNIGGKQVELKKAEPKGGAGGGRGGAHLGRSSSGQFNGGNSWGGSEGLGYSDSSYGGGFTANYGGMFGQHSQKVSGFGPSRGGRSGG